MKIAMIGHKEFNTRSGGVEVVVYELASRLADRGYQITAYDRGSKKNKKIYMDHGVTVRQVFTFKRESLNAVVSSFIATACAVCRDFDIIHYHAIGPSVPLAIAHVLGKKTVSTVHGLNWRCEKWGKFAVAYMKLGEKIAAKYADEVIVLSEEMRDYFLETYGRKTMLIRNAVSVIENRPCDEITTRFGLKKDEYILYVGRISPEKGPQDLVRAFKNANTGKKLVLAGQFTDNDFCRELKAMIGDRTDIICTGFADGKILDELYSNCCLYVLPSHTEGLALTLLEAMSSGALCLVSNIPENTCVLKDFGYSYEAQNIKSLTDALEKITGLEKNESRRDAQINYVRENYGYDAFIRLHEQVYRKLSSDGK